MDNQQKEGGKPPYGSFQTFWSFIEALGTKPLPPQVDRSMLDGKSGTDQMGILMALRAFGLIKGEDNKVQSALTALVVTDKEGRKARLGELVRSFYSRQLEVSDNNGTEKMLFDSFEDSFGLTGDTRRKAATWFLHAARESGIPVSQHFRNTRSGPGSLPGSRVRRTPKLKNATPQTTKNVEGDTSTGEDEITVKLQAGGSVTLRVNVSHVALSRNKKDRQFVQTLTDALTSYEDGQSNESDEEER
jgi:hypothetical protein